VSRPRSPVGTTPDHGPIPTVEAHVSPADARKTGDAPGSSAFCQRVTHLLLRVGGFAVSVRYDTRFRTERDSIQ
jgi:hypothetical protein